MYLGISSFLKFLSFQRLAWWTRFWFPCNSLIFTETTVFVCGRRRRMPGGNLVVIDFQPAFWPVVLSCILSNANPMLLNDIHRTGWLERATLVSFARATVRFEGGLAMLQTRGEAPGFFSTLPIGPFSMETERHPSTFIVATAKRFGMPATVGCRLQ